MPTARTLILVRHAHRSKRFGTDADNGLSPKGKAQARRILKYYLSVFPHARPLVISSPKRRCQETVAPLVREVGVRLRISPDLDEGGNMKRKIQNFLKAWKKTRESLTVLALHGDWIPFALEKMVGTSIELEKGGWIALRYENGAFHLEWAIQDFTRLRPSRH